VKLKTRDKASIADKIKKKIESEILKIRYLKIHRREKGQRMKRNEEGLKELWDTIR
jgi:hypothetical protein